MAYNKVEYGEKVLIDLTNDTVNQNKLMHGTTAHDKSGNIITGTLLQGYPEVFKLEEELQDSSGEFILDSSSENIIGTIIYDRR